MFALFVRLKTIAGRLHILGNPNLVSVDFPRYVFIFDDCHHVFFIPNDCMANSGHFEFQCVQYAIQIPDCFGFFVRLESSDGINISDNSELASANFPACVIILMHFSFPIIALWTSIILRFNLLISSH